PSFSAPLSFTTTRAPSAAKSSACSLPIPRPAPVTTATLPSSAPIGSAGSRMAEQAAGGHAGLLVVVDGDLAGHEHPPVPDPALDAPPLTAGEVVDLLDRGHVEAVEVVDDDVGRLPDLERAPVGESTAVRGEGRQLPVRLLERQDAVLPDGAHD